MIDLKDQISAYFDEIDPPFTIDDLMREPVAVEPPTVRPGVFAGAGRRRGPLVAVAVAFLLMVVVTVPLWLLNTDNPQPPADQIPVPTVAPTAAPEVPKLPEPSPDTVVDTKPEVPDGPDVDTSPDVIDYEVLGPPVATMETPLGTMSWVRSESVPVGWITLGFPMSTGYPDELLDMFTALPCCLELFHDTNDFLWVGPWSGVREPPLPSGYLALGPTGDSTERRAGTSEYRGYPRRVRGLEENEDPYDVVYGADNVGGADIRDRIDEGTLILEDFDDGRWSGFRGDFVFAPDEVWYSPDGYDWTLMSEDGLGRGAAVESQPYSVAQRDGRWVVIGWSDVTEGRLFAHGTPTVWLSDDLETWTEASGEFGREGMITRLTSVIVSERGWLIFGIHSTPDTPRRGEWGAWTSRDGQTWEEIPIQSVFGEPDCGATPVRDCSITPAFTADGRLVTYVNEAAGWTLWLGNWEE